MKLFRTWLFTGTFLCFANVTSWAKDPEWPKFRGPHADGSWNTPSLPKDLTRIVPKSLWSTSIGAGYGGVTVCDGRAYVMDRLTKPEEVERVLCFDATNGELLWKHSWPVVYQGIEYGSGPRASVTIHEGQAYALGATGMALCLDAKTGNVVWSQDTSETLGAQPARWGLAGSPVVWKDVLLLHLGAPNGTIVAVDRKNGKERWRAGDDPAGYSTPWITEVEGHPLLIQWGPEHVWGFDPDTGEKRWQFPYKVQYGVSIAQPIFHEGLLLVSGYWHGSRALQLESKPTAAKLAWSEENVLRGLMSQPLYKDGVVYLLDRSEGVVAFELKNGNILWKDAHHFTPKDRNPQISWVWADQSQNVMAGLNASGELIFAKLTREGFEEFSRHQIIGKTWAHPAFTQNVVFARSDTQITAWELWPAVQTSQP